MLLPAEHSQHQVQFKVALWPPQHWQTVNDS